MECPESYTLDYADNWDMLCWNGSHRHIHDNSDLHGGCLHEVCGFRHCCQYCPEEYRWGLPSSGWAAVVCSPWTRLGQLITWIHCSGHGPCDFYVLQIWREDSNASEVPNQFLGRLSLDQLGTDQVVLVGRRSKSSGLGRRLIKSKVFGHVGDGLLSIADTLLNCLIVGPFMNIASCEFGSNTLCFRSCTPSWSRMQVHRFISRFSTSHFSKSTCLQRSRLRACVTRPSYRLLIIAYVDSHKVFREINLPLPQVKLNVRLYSSIIIHRNVSQRMPKVWCGNLWRWKEVWQLWSSMCFRLCCA